ncbi:M3 family metallopeptidase [Parasutterella secunda]|uniref:oligopeptidase A n=1 Tax=Parasutterella secunda TaxID=626947 RepID=A0ABS2GS64_9BURK|nr:M3 family metallopeptidase [Parasutterella secunda]MBM6928680.1 M3 family metallopeptidase [Parasutterella secunda]
MSTNPLLSITDLIDFPAIKPEHVVPGMKALIDDAQKTLAVVTQDSTPATWDDVISPLEKKTLALSRAWGAVSHLMSVCDEPELRKAYNEALPIVTQFWIGLSQSNLSQKYKAIKESSEFKKLSSVRQRIINEELIDFKLAGAFLPEDKKAELKKVKETLAQESQKFSENLLDATNAYGLLVEDEKELAGIPADDIASFKETAEAAGQKGYRITLQVPHYLAVLQYAQNRKLRETLYHAYVTRASEFDFEGKFNNNDVMRRIVQLREEEAKLLGYKNYGEVSLATKMADSPEQVISFLRDLAQKSLPQAKTDMAEVKTFAKEKLGIEDPQSWDLPYASEKLREAQYSFSDQEVKQYFTLPAVFKGLFGLVQTLFNIQIVKDTAPVWHPDVQFFRIENEQGEKIAQFYMDLYARPNKRGGAWMDNDRTRNRLYGELQTPVAYLVCNFAKPVGDKPALLTHDDVLTLFHEFGHGLHHMLSRIEEPAASGINGVEWDAVECPSQFMENFAWDWTVLESLTSHVQTGEKLPRQLFEKMLAAKNFQSAMAMVRQLEFGLFDMLLHTQFNAQKDSILDLLNNVRKEVAVTQQPAYNRFANSFSHIFAGGYAAGYYSYKWAEVLSSDAFSLFEETGILNPQTGKKWLDEVLAVGSSRPAMESFIAFRGRAPRIDALLRHSGIKPFAK